MIYLASRSKRRRELLRKARIPFRVVRSSFKERTFLGGPRQTVIQNAMGKVKHARLKAKTGILLGADTMIYFRGKLIGKPKTKRAAVRMLFGFSGSSHEVFTGLALYHIETRKWKTAWVKSKVTMRKFTRKEAGHYLRKVNPLDKAGAYAIQEHGDRLVKCIVGSYTNVIGLPMEKLRKLLKLALRKEYK